MAQDRRHSTFPATPLSVPSLHLTDVTIKTERQHQTLTLRSASNDAPALLRSMLLQSLTPIITTTLRLSTKPSPAAALKIKTPVMPSALGLRIGRRESRTVLRAKDKSFNVEVDVEEEDSGEKCLNRFNREVARTGLVREWRRRMFRENARDKRMRKQREAALLRRRRYNRKGDSLSRTENAETQEDFWMSDESFEALVNDEDVSNEEIESRFQDDGEGTWKYIDRTSSS